jgi:tRNA threonylcarbamoyladenosine biosynthesis protein TsaE
MSCVDDQGTVEQVRVTLESVEATLALGEAVGNRLRAGDLVILSGPLGAGKTTLTKGIAAGMGVSGRVTSPTFVIARVHRPRSTGQGATGQDSAGRGATGQDSAAQDSAARDSAGQDSTGRDARSVPLVHVDAYRLAGAVELDDLDLDTDLAAAAMVVEWGEGVAEQLSAQRLLIALDPLLDDSRTATLTPVGGSWSSRLPEIIAAGRATRATGRQSTGTPDSPRQVRVDRADQLPPRG